ncbi:MAG: hypothetical protein RL186_1819, partial [Pseudomonadota bacterium]
WGNIVQGVELCRRVDGREVLGVTQPLLMTANGQKMGKTATGAVWLDGDLLAPFDFWQFWRNVDDADVEPLLKRMTDLPLDEIARLAALQGAEINIAKIALANAATAMLHGQAAADLAQATASQQFGGTAGDGGEAQGLPEFALSAADLPTSIGALFVHIGLLESNGEAKRQANGGGLRVDDQSVSDASAPLPAQLLENGAVKLSVGKKRHVRVVLT